MNVRFLLIFLCIFILYFKNTNPAEAYSTKYRDSHIILIQNTAGLSEDYPAVNKMESKVFGSSYPQEDIYNRLGRLELKIFGAVSNKTLSDRVDDLSKIIIGSNNASESEENYASSDRNTYQESSSENDSSTSEDEALNNLLNQMEKKLLNQVYPNDTTETRVARLERYIFNDSSDEYSMNERIERLATVIKAQPDNEIYHDMGILNNNQMVGNGISLAALILMIIAGLIL